jgi:hypothetical protein
MKLNLYECLVENGTEDSLYKEYLSMSKVINAAYDIRVASRMSGMDSADFSDALLALYDALDKHSNFQS